MTPTRPNYGRYLLGWLGVWLLLTVPTQLPECYERSMVNAPWEDSSVFSELVGFAGSRSLVEVPCGLVWASLSWLLQWGTSSTLGRLRKAAYFQGRDFRPCLWGMASVVLLACGETVLLGAPLAHENTDWANFSLCIEDSPAVTITDRSIRIESTGILLAFPLACLAAGYFGGVRQKAQKIVGTVADQEGVWPPPPRSS